jgi:predicted outer membrane protein
LALTVFTTMACGRARSADVKGFAQLLSAHNTVSVPNARNPELREFVNVLKPAVSAHLAHAEQVRAAVATRK